MHATLNAASFHSLSTPFLFLFSSSSCTMYKLLLSFYRMIEIIHNIELNTFYLKNGDHTVRIYGNMHGGHMHSANDVFIICLQFAIDFILLLSVILSQPLLGLFMVISLCTIAFRLRTNIKYAF